MVNGIAKSQTQLSDQHQQNIVTFRQYLVRLHLLEGACEVVSSLNVDVKLGVSEIP